MAAVSMGEPLVSRVGGRVSWGALFAGFFFGFAAWMLLLALGAGIGFTAFDARDVGQWQGFGIGFGIWGVIAAIVSFFFAGAAASAVGGAAQAAGQAAASNPDLQQQIQQRAQQAQGQAQQLEEQARQNAPQAAEAAKTAGAAGAWAFFIFSVLTLVAAILGGGAGVPKERMLIRREEHVPVPPGAPLTPQRA